MSINKTLKSKKFIQTDIGDFEYVKSLGEGGNSFVFHFKKGEADFAIKFLKTTDESKLNRFKDEYFCAAQIPSHKNIVHSYHFDKVLLEGDEYFIIIMKFYDGTLGSEGTISTADSDDKSEKAWLLFTCLANGLSHLHTNKIIHRDLKPQNVFFDSMTKEYVIGDLGIAHFSDEKFERESKTKPSERMANFGFSAPEQINSKDLVQASCDIYSLGQVLYWYLIGSTIRGLEMTPVSSSNSPDKLKYLDKVIKKCLTNDPSKRFQSISEISEYLNELKKPARHDYWPALHLFDDSIRRSLPKIKGTLDVDNVDIINRFFKNFHANCNLDDFWYMSLEGGDNTFTGIEYISDSNYLFCHMTEVNISKLLVYRNSGYPYKNFFILLLEPSSPFELVDDEGRSIARKLYPESSMDYATLWNGKYIDSDETDNGYYEYKGDVLTVNCESFKDRIRHLEKYAYIVVPKGSATACMMDRTPTERFLERVVHAGTIEDASLRIYLNETRPYHSSEITMYN
ncbi:serine/threonine protein kinase [Photobacterium phosphoreum]|nr:protein kinase [Photobacterium phosphoreum]